jgi:hypothetical protein
LVAFSQTQFGSPQGDCYGPEKNFFFCSFATVVLLCCLPNASAQNQTTKQPDDNQTLHSLLNEVRLLRRTLQQTGLNAYRSQIIVERMRTHSEQVLRLTRVLEEARNDAEKIEATIPRLIEQTKLMEGQIERETDVNKRALLKFLPVEGLQRCLTCFSLSYCHDKLKERLIKFIMSWIALARGARR